MRILVDADACPVPIREILFRAADRVGIKTVFVANQRLRIPDSQWIEFVKVRAGINEADHKIVEMTRNGDLVITSDIPLASRVVEKGGSVIGPRGEVYNDSNIGNRKAIRKMMERVRIVSEEPFGPKPMHIRDRKAFANQLDYRLTRMQNKSRSKTKLRTKKPVPPPVSSPPPQSSSSDQSLT